MSPILPAAKRGTAIPILAPFSHPIADLGNRRRRTEETADVGDAFRSVS
jgi:hypothetical protein